MDYSSHQILEPDQVDALVFASNFPWARALTDSELIVIPIGENSIFLSLARRFYPAGLVLPCYNKKDFPKSCKIGSSIP